MIIFFSRSMTMKTRTPQLVVTGVMERRPAMTQQEIIQLTWSREEEGESCMTLLIILSCMKTTQIRKTRNAERRENRMPALLRACIISVRFKIVITLHRLLPSHR